MYREAAAPFAPSAARGPAVPDTLADAFLADCLHGLSQPQKAIPCKWLYDDIGSALFERICAVPEYYPSRTELALLAGAAPWLAAAIAPGTTLVEFGSGASRKTRLLLDAAPAIAAYVPIDISEPELRRAACAIAADYPGIAVHPLLGDFTGELGLDPAMAGGDRFGFFPGSTLGNFTPDEAIAFLAHARALLGQGSRLLLGVDLAKDEDTLLAAYADAGGVTAAFNLNLLARMNREFGCAIDLIGFRHTALWNGAASRIEMHLVSRRQQSIAIGEVAFPFTAGETIHTENSHKFSPEALEALIHAAGWRIERRWHSAAPSYALMLLRT